METRDLRSYFTSHKNEKKKSQTGIPELVNITGNVTAVMASAVNAELESFSKKKGVKGSSYNTRIPSRVKAKKEVALFPEISRMNFFYHLPIRIIEYVSEYIFLI